MSQKRVAAQEGLHQMWYHTGEGENFCELVILRDEAEVAAAQRMYEDTNGDMGEVVVAPVREVPTLAGLIAQKKYDPDDFI